MCWSQQRRFHNPTSTPSILHQSQNLLLHPERGVDAVFEEARAADEQGYDSIWLFDHLMEFRGEPGPDLPLDSFTLKNAADATTEAIVDFLCAGIAGYAYAE